jgi:hypothetical protein
MEIDVFVVHSKSDPSQASMYDYLRGQAAKCDVKVLAYDDWEWEREGERIPDVRAAAYREFDPYEQLSGRINKETLTRLWEQSRVLIVLNPAGCTNSDLGLGTSWKDFGSFMPRIVVVGHQFPWCSMSVTNDCSRSAGFP